TDVGRLTEQPGIVQDRLTLEDSVDGAPVDQDALAQAVELNIHDLRDEPPLGNGGQCPLQAAQLIVLSRQGLEPHGSKLELAQPPEQLSVLTAQRITRRNAFLQPLPGGGG